MLEPARAWWKGATYGADQPARQVVALAVLGILAGLGESAVVVLIVAIASSTASGSLPLITELPSSSWALAALAAGVLVGLALAHLGSAWISAQASSGAQRRVQSSLVAAYLNAPWLSRASVRAGELQDLVTMKAAMVAHGSREAATALSTLANLCVILTAAILIEPWAALVLLAAIAFAAAIAAPFRAHRRRIAGQNASSFRKLAIDVAESAAGSRDLEVFGVRDAAQRTLDGSIDELARQQRSVRFAGAAVPSLTRDATVLLLALAITVIVTSSEVPLAVLGATTVLLLRALSQAQALMGLSYVLREREANLEMIRGRLELWQPASRRGALPCPSIERVELRAVCFSYPGSDEPTLDEITLELRRGERVGIIGRTGAGKTTLASLLLGQLEPSRGELRVDGVALNRIDRSEWHQRIAWIGQHPHLLTGTLAENISFLRPRISRSAIITAAERAGLGPELERWTVGLEHQVGPAGGSLSGGERQRVALARALAGDPDLLVLDEPTSALDPRTEGVVRSSLEQIGEEAVVVVIAHRPSTVRWLDRIAVVEDGRLLTIATPGELERPGAYLDDAPQSTLR